MIRPVTNVQSPEIDRTCECGVLHGSETALVTCLRRQVRALTTELAPIRKLRADIAKLPMKGRSRKP